MTTSLCLLSYYSQQFLAFEQTTLLTILAARLLFATFPLHLTTLIAAALAQC